MKTRVITALMAFVIFIPIVWYGSWPLLIGTLILGIIGLSEIFSMKKIPFFSLIGLFTTFITILIMLPTEYLTFMLDGLGIWHVYFVYAMSLLVMTVLSNNTFTFDDAGVFLLSSLYIGTGFHYFYETAKIGFLMVMFVMSIIWATDIGAYLIGMRFGKNKLAPIISPNKSIEGAIGGVVTAVLVSLIFIQFYNPLNFSVPIVILIAVLLSIVGQLGDLTESAYKRYFGVKDSGKILPGHGGILDRFDSTLFVMPLFQIILHFVH
ncbi:MULTISPECIES: phosphatidate cytidylyltransferase [unclassified Jeotgalibaca]|uniref:phosphatidate cytidylyltransferase n=1 Tax=unclassified Jeotgalibaca TaxID=2621505 RepID=UPI003FD5AAAF